MALSGSFYNDFRTGYRLQVEWSATQDRNANTSTVTSYLYLISLGAGYNMSSSNGKATQMVVQANYTDTGWVDTGSANVTLSGNQKKLLASYSHTMNHNSDGTLTVSTMGGYVNFAGMNVNGTLNEVYVTTSNVVLDTIPRASTISSGVNWTAGVDNLWITIARADSSFHHTLEIWVQHTYDGNYDLVGQRTNIQDSTTWIFTQAENTQLYNTIAMYENRTVILRVYTYNSSGTAIGSYQDKYGTVNAVATGFPSVSDFNIGNTTVPVTIQGWTSGFTYDVTFTFGSFTKSWNGITTSTMNMDFTITDNNAMYQVIPNSISGQATVRVRTKYNNVFTEDGLPANIPDQTTITLSVVNSNPTFTTASYLDTNTTITAVTGNSAYIVQNKSTIQAKVLNVDKAVAQNYATISQYIASVSGQSITLSPPFATDLLFNFLAINATVDQNLTIAVYDSRGFVTTVTLVVKVVPYTPPAVITTAARASGFLDSTTITLSGSIAPLNVNGTDMNSLVAASTTWQTRVVGGSYGAATAFLGQTLTMPNYSASSVSTNLLNTSAWEILITVTDKIGNTAVTLTVAIGVPLVFIDSVMKNFGFGKFPRSGYSIDAALDISTDTKFLEAGTTLLDKYAPAGIVQIFAGDTAPSGWLLCQGQAISRTTYSRLYGIIGTTYGTGDGSTTFNLPDLRGNVPVGYTSLQTEFNALGKKGGERTHVLTTGEMPAHTHNIIEDGGRLVGKYGGADAGSNGYQYQGSGRATTFTTDSQGGGTAHNNLQPYITMNFIIRT